MIRPSVVNLVSKIIFDSGLADSRLTLLLAVLVLAVPVYVTRQSASPPLLCAEPRR
jgi:hypothetical protein